MAKPRRQFHRPLALEPLEPRIALSAASLIDAVSHPSGALDGKIVYTSGGHGWEWLSSGFSVNRPDSNEVVEPFGNQDQMTYFADYILRAGGTVVPMRPIGHQFNEVVLDNDSPGVTYSGAWSNSANSVYYDEDYGASADAVSYRFASTSATETAVATYTPDIPEAGFYPVYTWVLDSGNRADQLYRINDSGGGVTEIRVDHRMVGKGWVYLGTYHFDQGTSGSVEISNQSTDGSVVIADAIRFGNGMGDMPDGPNGINTGTITGQPREDEASLLWTWRSAGQGVNRAAVIGTGNVSAPHRMAEHMNADTNPFGSSVYIGFHSNAGGGRGAVGLIDQNNATPNQAELAIYTGRQINQDMQALNGTFEHNWSNRTTHTFTSSFGEINLGNNAEFDATIIETAFHDSVEDAELMRDPKVRDQMARSTYEAVLEYFDNFGGLNAPVSQPSKPLGVTAEASANGEITVSWTPGPASSALGGAPMAHRVYVSRDGYGYVGYVEVAGSGAGSYTFDAADLDTDPYYFKVVAVNSGGESPRSAVTVARQSDAADPRILIVDGFDRNSRLQNERYPFAPGSGGLTDRVRMRYNNSFDYVIQYGEALEGVNAAVSAAQNERVISGAVALSDYDAVIWFTGEESTADDTFDAAEQTLVSNYLAAGGKLFVSGAEVAWDLDNLNNGRAFYNNQFRSEYVADDAATYDVIGAPGSIFDGLSFSFTNGSGTGDSQFYNVDFPDVIGVAAPGGEQILDNDAGAPVYEDTGGWSSASGAGFNGGSFRFALSGGAGAATWNFSVGEAARGELFVYYAAASNRATNAVYHVETGAGTETFSVNQTQNGDSWVSLGAFDFSAGDHSVTLDAAASSGGSVVIADAVRAVIEEPGVVTGDFDDDDLVDGRDFLAWQRGFGSFEPTQADGDGNNDEMVDGDDLAIWSDQYGSTAASAAITRNALNYVGGSGGGAAVQYDSGGATKLVNFGFPFETISDAADRGAVLERVMEFFGFSIAQVAGATSISAESPASPQSSNSPKASAELAALADRAIESFAIDSSDHRQVWRTENRSTPELIIFPANFRPHRLSPTSKELPQSSPRFESTESNAPWRPESLADRVFGKWITS